MTKVSVVIPYFQRQPRLLRRALEKIYAQDVAADVSVEAIVVDDQSPSPPEAEIEGLQRPGYSVRIVKRANGGPAAARNTGLDAARGADFIAFLDSDDWWAPEHLRTALAALASGAQFYFANNIYDEDKTWFAGLAVADELVAASQPLGGATFSVARETILPFFLKECLAHTSTVVLDARRAGHVRFDEDQALAGEDYLFWLTAAALCDRLAFSTAPMAFRGRGIDLYRGALDWDSPDCVRRLYYALTLHKKILARFCETRAQRTILTAKIDLLRRGILYLLMRNALAHAGANRWVLARLPAGDPGFWLTLPRNAFVTISQKLAGKLEFPIG